ncbi:hypothetical protein AgCh_017992 [Apium graveolens]
MQKNCGELIVLECKPWEVSAYQAWRESFAMYPWSLVLRVGRCWERNKTEEFDIQPKEIRKAIGQTSGIVKPSRKLNRGRPYVQALLNELNARIPSTANTLQNQERQRRNISSSSNLI